MNRREFIKLTACAGFGSLLLPGCSFQGSHTQMPPKKAATVEGSPPRVTDLIMVEGNDPAAMLNKGFDALGGISNFVKPGNTVVLKPNFSVPRLPEEACTTNPVLVASLVKMCLQVGAKEVKVIDYPFTNPIICLEKTGIKNAVTAAGGKIYALNNGVEKYFSRVQTNGTMLGEVYFSKDVLDADVFINMPILKHHYITEVTMGLKNMMGLVWDRGIFHTYDLHQCIAELAAFKKPHLTILDALRGITASGPTGPGPIKEYNQLVFGTDPVAVDAYGAFLFGMKPTKINYLRMAAEMGSGQIDWEKLNVKRI
ncbi:DUF362 domain-containing protein [Pelosinus sp. sgz500959]|uniref:DUF362 domain-containing protein n=1 Tax=Pelosinus sp. sgz500959 TaxID=3242472 RepID=UPI003670810A